MKVLVTGGAGMIGSWCAAEYKARGHEVVIVDNFERSKLLGHENKPERLFYNASRLKKMGVYNACLDISQPSSFKDLEGRYGGFDTIIHCAAQCVDSETEYLSRSGWKRIADYDGMEVAQYNPDGTANFVHPVRFIKEPASEMWAFSSPNGLDQCLSPEHTFVYVDQRSPEKPKQMPVHELRARHEESVCGFRGQVLTSFRMNTKTALPLSDAELRLQIAVIADGWFRGRTNRVEISLKKDRKRTRLRMLLDAAGVNYIAKVNRRGVEKFKFNAPLRKKEFGAEFFSCSAEQLQIVCDEVLHWDGDQKKQFTSTSAVSAHFIQYAFSATGHRATIVLDRRSGRKDCYRVCVTARNLLSLARKPGKKLKIIPASSKDGFKYCFTVPSSMLVLRRNGKIFITGNCGVPPSIENPRRDFEVNALGTLNVLEYARKHRSTVVYASTNKVYPIHGGWTLEGYRWRWVDDFLHRTGWAPWDVKEAFCNGTRTPYGASKYTGDLYCQEYAKLYDMKIGVFRMSCIAAEHQLSYEEQGWLVWFAIANITGQKLNIYGDGLQVRDVLHAQDVWRAYDAFVQSEVPHGVWNLGGGPEQTLSLKECLWKIEDITRRPFFVVNYGDWRPSDQRIYTSNIGPLKKDLGWQPTIGIDALLQRVCEWVKANKAIF